MKLTSISEIKVGDFIRIDRGPEDWWQCRVTRLASDTFTVPALDVDEVSGCDSSGAFTVSVAVIRHKDLLKAILSGDAYLTQSVTETTDNLVLY